VNQEQREQCEIAIEGLRDPFEDDLGFVRFCPEYCNQLALMMQSMLDRIDELEASQAITLRDQFAIAIASGFMTNGGYKSSVLEQVYNWADAAMKGRGQ
jgi:hypothetical protein